MISVEVCGYGDFCHFVLYSSITFICTYAYAIYICCILVNKDSLPVHLFWFAMVPAAGIEGQLSRVGFMPCFINASLTTPKGNGVIPYTYWLCFNPAWTGG